MKFKTWFLIMLMILSVLMVNVMTGWAQVRYDPSSIQFSNKENERHGGSVLAMTPFITEKIISNQIPANIQSKLNEMQRLLDIGKMDEARKIEREIESQRYEVRLDDNKKLYISSCYPDRNQIAFALPLTNQAEVFYPNCIPNYSDKNVWIFISMGNLNFDEIKRKSLNVSGIQDQINSLVYDKDRDGFWLNLSAYPAGKYFAIITVDHLGGMSTTMILFFKIRNKYEIRDQFGQAFGVFDPSRALSDAEKNALQYCIGSTASDGSDFVKNQNPINPANAVGPPSIDQAVGPPPINGIAEKQNFKSGILKIQFYSDLKCSLPTAGPNKISVFVDNQKTGYFEKDITQEGKRVRQVTFNSVPSGKATIRYIDNKGIIWCLKSENGQKENGQWYWRINPNTATVMKMYKKGGN